MKKQNGYSHKNYLIESASKATTKACIYASLVAGASTVTIITAILAHVNVFTVNVAYAIVPIAILFWLSSWWIMFDRIVTYTHWLAWYEDYYEPDSPTPPPTQANFSLYELENGDYVMPKREGKGNAAKPTAKL